MHKNTNFKLAAHFVGGLIGAGLSAAMSHAAPDVTDTDVGRDPTLDTVSNSCGYTVEVFFGGEGADLPSNAEV